MQHAVIEGRRVSWIKIYDDLGSATLHYEGTVHADGEEIEGTWHIPGDWSGTFMMVRRRKEGAHATRMVGETAGAR